MLPLLARDGDRIIGDGTLHGSRAEARRHIGEVRIVIDPEYRNRGVGRTLLRALLDAAHADDAQLEKLVFEVVANTERAATHTAEAMGFVKAHHHAFTSTGVNSEKSCDASVTCETGT